MKKETLAQVFPVKEHLSDRTLPVVASVHDLSIIVSYTEIERRPLLLGRLERRSKPRRWDKATGKNSLCNSQQNDDG